KGLFKQIGLEEGIQRGIEKGFEKGIEKGIEKGKLEGKLESTNHQYNLSALTKRFEEIEENNENQRLVRWLNLFARHKLRQLKELKHLEKEEPVLWKAYELLTHLPKEVEESSQEVEKMYEFNDVQKGLFKQIGLEEGIQRGIEKGIEKGKLEGKLESSKEVAIRLLEMGLDLSVIQKATQLSLNQIESLKNDQK
ncbi:MAG: hypothetical protein FJ161_02495, partial [Gammaproteobacteria bacterium]|nr:hypothetical protein [Gammaproteobacteria bacterium]